jgi:bacterioferritin
MKVAPEIINSLNDRLAEEHSAYVQYTTHALMCKNFGYMKLADYIGKRAEQEKEHAQELIDRILYLEGVPLFENITTVNVGSDVIEMFPNDKTSELTAIAGYITAIELCMFHKDFGTKKLIEHILSEEEEHLSDIEAIEKQITLSGIENYLVVQI